MNFPQAIKSGFKNYVNFSGRASRSEYWYWTLFVILGNAVFTWVDIFVLHAQDQDPHALEQLSSLFAAAVIIPFIAVAVRRLHDIDYRGWWVILNFIPIIMFLIIFWYCRKGTDGDNRFGPDPLA